ncbi:MAG TPA: acetolactate synthase small subunit [Candidatus Aerophobetes bacterium]|uniref:Acetolactate synthase small subunit n=1 Tax=Aerophobetes bacterium TaxID=2030807 RepID=A0A662DBZ5_UNCAE|nr:MAG: acetolactate synthase small subunit [Candidatus Aerophobetes bacterium]HDN84174.1 acetolactate synthase small subunit [Candidatus Aerophobetes bacterium]
MKHLISVEVENRFGILARIASLFSARGFNIDSLAVGETEDPTVSRITMVVPGDDQVIEQVIKQLRKLIDVIKVVDLTNQPTVTRELVLVRVSARGRERDEVMRLVDIFRARIVDVHPESLTLEVTGDEEKIGGLLTLLRPFGIKKLVRTGKVALAREYKG